MEGPGPGVFAGIFGGAVGSGTFSSGIVIGTSRIPAPASVTITWLLGLGSGSPRFGFCRWKVGCFGSSPSSNCSAPPLIGITVTGGAGAAGGCGGAWVVVYWDEGWDEGWDECWDEGWDEGWDECWDEGWDECWDEGWDECWDEGWDECWDEGWDECWYDLRLGV